MALISKASLLFGAFALLGALPVVWAFWGLFAQRTTFGALYWGAMPLVALVVSAAISRAILQSVRPSRLGPGLGAVAALLSLIVCTLVVSLPAIGNGFFGFFPIILLAALASVGWFVVLLGALAGWVCQRYVMSEP